MDYIPLVRSSAFLPFCAFLREAGIPLDRLLSLAHMHREPLNNGNRLIPLVAVSRFLEHAARRLGISNFGLLVGQRTELEHLGPFGILVRRSLTLGQAIDNACRLIGTFDSGAAIWVDVERDPAWIFHRNLAAPCAGSAQASQYGLMLLLKLVRMAAGQDWKPSQVHLQFSWDRAVAGFEAFSPGTLHFDRAASGLAFPRELLPRPLQPRLESELPGEIPDMELMQASAPARNLAGSLAQLLLSEMQLGHPGIQRIAELSGASVRSLQRQLHVEGTDFSLLTEQVRFSRAIEMLEEPRVRLREVAKELGYRNSASLTRAFRRWSGMSPQMYRRHRSEVGWSA